MRVLGIDPGLQFAGLALVDRGIVESRSLLRGRSGLNRDWPLAVAVARTLAQDVVTEAARLRPDVVAIAQMDDRQKARSYRWRHTSAAAAQAVYDALRTEGYGEAVPILWQPSHEVLADRPGSGGLGYLSDRLQRGDPPRQLGIVGELSAPEARAVCHALWREALVRRERERLVAGQ